MKFAPKKLLSLMLAVVMAASLATPALATEPSEPAVDETITTYADLAAIDAALVPQDADETLPLTIQEVIGALLDGSGLSEDLLGAYPEDYNALAESLGMIADAEEVETICTDAKLAEMETIWNELCAAVNPEDGTMEPLFLNGMAQPIFPYTSGAVEKGYSNADSDTIRYFVYVETNYDTDADGKLDLVKALVQMPRAAAEGDYQAATIFEARPYITGCTPMYGYDETIYNEEGYDIVSMYDTTGLEPRGVNTDTIIDTWEKAESFVNAAVSSAWYYVNPYESDIENDYYFYDYEDLDWYDYYLVRGFAVVEAGGLGTRGSEGFETCGTDLEIDAFKCIIEWLHGDRVAYTDSTGETAIEAYWSNGQVGMTGRSYAGTTQFGLATTGVEGLETIVPVAGIASWYDYTNSQGISTSRNTAYSDSLAGYCAGRYLDDEDWNSIVTKYGGYLYQLMVDQKALNGDYADEKNDTHWASRDYTTDWENIDCAALIVHGLADYNVRPKHFEMMYDAYAQAVENGQVAAEDVKLLLHQDGHVTPTYPSSGYSFLIGDESYDAILNKWFTHYLFDVDNGIQEELAPVTAQNNLMNTWDLYDSWESDKTVTLKADTDEETTTISSNYAAIEVDRKNWESTFIGGPTPSSTMYTMEVTEDTVIKGSIPVNFSAAVANEPAVVEEGAEAPAETPLAERDALMVSAMLVDMAPAGETFNVYKTSGSYVPKNTLAEGGYWQAGNLKKFDLVEMVTTEVSSKVIAYGWMDLCNPEAGFVSGSANKQISLEEGKYNDYTIYLQPNVYEVQEGHTLALIIYPYEPGKAAYTQNYTITLDNSTVNAQIPVDEAYGTIDPEALPFTDMDRDDWFYGAVEYVYENGIMNGTSPSTFGPQGQTTRGMIVTMLYRMEGEPGYSAEAAFEDVAADKYYADAINWAAENGIVTGTSDTTFAPDKKITREQMAAILYRYAQYLGIDVAESEDTNILSFEDAETVSEYAVTAMQWACGEGLINGISGKLAPQKGATRAQVATILMRFCENVAV